MQCPFYGKEMISGRISGEGSTVFFDDDNKVRSVFDVLNGAGLLP